MSTDENRSPQRSGDWTSEDGADGSSERLLSRRTFLGCLLGTTAVLGFAGMAAPVVRYVFPVTDAAAAPKLEVAKLSELEPGKAVAFDYQEMPCVLVADEVGSKPKAFSLVCPHLGCICKWQEDTRQFFCPCHAGVFAIDGSVVEGPPPRSLDQLNVIVAGDQVSVKGLMDQ